MKIVPYQHKVQYYETDKMQVAHHSNYIRWLEEARVDFMEQAGFSYDRMEKEGIISPVVSVQCNYKRMTRFGEVVLVYLNVEKFNGIRLVVNYEIREKETGELRCTGKSTHCYLNGAGAPVHLRDACPACYQMFEEAKSLTFSDFS